MDFWQVLPVAVALVFIIEGAMPFISPNHWRNMLALVAQMDELQRGLSMLRDCLYET